MFSKKKKKTEKEKCFLKKGWPCEDKDSVHIIFLSKDMNE